MTYLWRLYMKKDILYKECREYLYNKDKYVSTYIESMLLKTNKMFTYQNLPNTVPSRILEYYLQKNGNVIFTEVNNNFYVFTGGKGGVLNEYYEYTQYIVNNPFLKLNKAFTIDKDCVLVRNDSCEMGLLPMLSKNAVLNNDVDITLNIASKIMRAIMTISASDDKTYNSAQKYIENIDKGVLSVIAENAFLDGVKMHNGVNIQSGYINNLIELTQYQKATAFNELGLNANYNMKRERLNTSEVSMNNSILLPLANNMLISRKESIEKINAMYNLNIDVDLNGAWLLEKELQEQDIENVKTDSVDISNNKNEVD